MLNMSEKDILIQSNDTAEKNKMDHKKTNNKLQRMFVTFRSKVKNKMKNINIKIKIKNKRRVVPL